MNPSETSRPTPPGLENLTLLGSASPTQYPTQYNPLLLETVPSPVQESYWVKFNCPEFTSLCPKTGQPDFAALTISYVPDQRIVESKSLKLYLFSFRNHGAFHEAVVNIIRQDLQKVLEPRYIEVWGKFLPRGGLSIDPYTNWGKPGTPFAELAEFRFRSHDLNPEKVDNR
ncbi:MAG: preQ(1) synthase [Oligosphaeraceae bacterium]